ncbi:S-adenosyl-L-methionine-dependent methyltransferase [Daldinia sp. FL1419]|nr:S-adenosyl-L-methionine-dependent methyltransferase [Daldinia sp. FL1419]
MTITEQKELQKLYGSFAGGLTDEELERTIANSERIMRAHLQDCVDPRLLKESKVVCADFNENLMNILKRRATKYRWINVETAVIDAQHSDFQESSFSHVTLNCAMHTIPKPEDVLVDAMRILQPGGVFAFSTWHKYTKGWGPDMRSCFESLPFDAPMPDPVPMAIHGKLQWTDPKGLEGELRAHGFENIQVNTVSHTVHVNSAEDYLRSYRTMKDWMVNTYWNEESKQKAQGMLDGHIVSHLQEKYKGERWDLSWTAILATCQRPES